MPVGKIIIGYIGEMIIYIIFDVMIQGIGRFFRVIFYWLRKLLTGKNRETPEFKWIENRYLFKKLILITDFNNEIQKGTRATVMEIIDQQHFYVEFENSNGEPIVFNDQQIFKIQRNKVRLERKSQ